MKYSSDYFFLISMLSINSFYFNKKNITLSHMYKIEYLKKKTSIV